MINGVEIVNLKILSNKEGRVFHGLKKSESTFKCFGEAYFSTIYQNKIKAWKKHKKMSLNLIVLFGEIKFVIYDDRLKSKTNGNFQTITLSQNNYKRLVIPPRLWVGFQGISLGESFLLNIADIEHTPSECLRLEINDIDYNWKV